MAPYLENGEQGTGDGIEIWGWSPLREIEWSSKDLHAKECKDEDEEKEKKEERHNWRDGIHQSYHQVPKWGPIPENKDTVSILSYGEFGDMYVYQNKSWKGY